MIPKRTIGVVGTSHAGVAAVLATFIRGLAREIILIDKDANRAAGEAMDHIHGQAFFERITEWAGDYQDRARAQLVYTAGAAKQAGAPRLDLLNRRAAVFGEIRN